MQNCIPTLSINLFRPSGSTPFAVCVCVCACVRSCVRARACVRACERARACMRVRVCVRAYVRACAYVAYDDPLKTFMPAVVCDWYLRFINKLDLFCCKYNSKCKSQAVWLSAYCET